MIQYCSLSLVLLLLWVAQAVAATYYVNNSGSCAGCSDANSCGQAQTVTTAKDTVSDVFADCNLQPGDTVEVRTGTYTETLLNVIPSGTSGNPVTLKRYQAETPMFLAPSTGGDSPTIEIGATRAWIVLDGLKIDMTNRPNTGFYIRGDNVTVQNCEVQNMGNAKFENNGGGGITTATTANAVLIKNNKVHHIGWTATISPTKIHGVYHKGTNGIIEQNELYNNGGFGVHLYDSGGVVNDNIIRNNRTHHNGSVGILAGSGDRNLVHGNLIWQNGQKLVAPGLRMSSTDDPKAYNNTIWDNNGNCIQLSSSSTGTPTTGAIVRNNICWQNNVDNIVNANTNVSGTVSSNNLLGVNPLFITPGTNFHLQSGSPAINAGFNITSVFTTDFDGTAHGGAGATEIGAYNFGTQVTPLLLQFSTPPATTQEDTNTTVIARVVDSAGQVQTGHANNCVMTLTSGTGSITGTTSVVPASGVCTWVIAFTDVGTKQVTVTSTGATSVLSPFFAITATPPPPPTPTAAAGVVRQLRMR